MRRYVWFPNKWKRDVIMNTYYNVYALSNKTESVKTIVYMRVLHAKKSRKYAPPPVH